MATLRCLKSSKRIADSLLGLRGGPIRPFATAPFSIADTARKLADVHLNHRVLEVTESLTDDEQSFSVHRARDLREAYAIQAAVADIISTSGPARKLAGYKIGATNPAAQQRMGLTEPFYGVLYECNFTRAPAPTVGGGESFVHKKRASRAWNLRGAELEYAFEIGRDVTPRADGRPWDAVSILTQVYFVYPAIEAVSSRLRLPLAHVGASAEGGSGGAGATSASKLTDIPTPCKIADQAMHGHAIVSPYHYMTPESWTRFVAASGRSGGPAGSSAGSVAPQPPSQPFSNAGVCGVSLSVDGEVKARGTGAAVMGNPAAALAWLANKLNSEGSALKAGQIIISGTLCTPPLVPVPHPATVPAKAVHVAGDFTGFGRVEMQLIE